MREKNTAPASSLLLNKDNLYSARMVCSRTISNTTNEVKAIVCALTTPEPKYSQKRIREMIPIKIPDVTMCANDPLERIFSRRGRGGRCIIPCECGSKLKAVAGKPSVMRFIHRI